MSLDETQSDFSPSDNPEFSLEDGLANDESLASDYSASESGSIDEPSLADDKNNSADFVGWAYLVEPESDIAETETEPEIVEISAPVFYSSVSAEYTVYGSYADLAITHGGATYEFVVPSEQLDKLIIKVGSNGSLILINNSGSNVVLQGKVNYESTNASGFYQLTIPANNLASSVYDHGGYCYITTYYVYNDSLRSQYNYLSNPLSGSLSTDNLSEDYTSAPSFYTYVMGMLFLLVAMLMSLSFKWRSKLHDK